MARLSSDLGTADTATQSARSRKMSETQQQQVTAVMTLTDGFDSIQVDELQRQLNERKNSKSILLRLPAELRNYIFELALIHSLHAPENSKEPTWADDPNASANAHTFAACKDLRLGPSTMNACRQMRRECQDLLCLDSVVVKRYRETSRISKSSLPMQLIQDLRSVSHFKAFAHDSEKEARKVAQGWCIGVGAAFSGVFACDPALGVKWRSFIAWDTMNNPRNEQFQISKHRRTTYSGKWG